MLILTWIFKFNNYIFEKFSIFIIRLSAKGTDRVMKPISVFHFLKFPDMVFLVRPAHYRTRGGEWRGGIAANPAFLYVVGHL